MIYLIATISVTFFLAIVLVILLLGGRSAESVRLMEVTSEARASSTAMGRAGGRPFLDADQVARALGPLHRLLGSSQDSDLSYRLNLAGYRNPSYAEIFYAVKILIPVLAALVGGLLIKENMFFWVVVLAAVGFLLPDLWLTQAIAKRRDHIRLSLPDALDLLVICMEAGLGLDQAIIRVGQELKLSHPELSDEFLLVNLEQRAGKPRIEAWRKMGERSGVESVRSFVQMLVQTERFGTPVSKSLGVFADTLRTQRRQQAEEMAAKTTIKLIPPLVLFIFPNLFIVLLGPAIITIGRNLGKVLGGE